jgi:histone-lysine N-methyltransferase SETMAR
MKPGTIWLPADAELPVRVKRTIASKKRMLIVFWGIHGITHCCRLPKDSTFDSPFFCEVVLSPTRSENPAKSRRTRKRLILIHMDNARVRAAKATQEKLIVSLFKRTPQPRYSPDIAPSDFFFSVG